MPVVVSLGWIAISVYGLVAIIKKRLRVEHGLYIILHASSQITDDEFTADPPNQLDLFD